MLIPVTGGSLGRTYTDVGGGAMTGASLMTSPRTYPTLKSHKQDGSILETGWPKVSNI